MSSRQLRKLQQQRELEQAALRAEEESESEEEIVHRASNKPSAFASFALLDEGNEDESPAEEESDQDEEPPKPEIERPKPVASKKSKKSKKKNKRKEAKVDATKEAAGSKEEDGEDEIDAALKALNLQNAGKGNATETTKPVDAEYEKTCALLGISSQHLKVANEMRNLFGRTAVDNHDNAGGQVGRGARRRRAAQQQVDLETALKGHHPPGKGLPELTLRRNIFIQGKDDWPRGSTGGLSMEVVDDMRSTDGTVEFRYVHDQAYDTLQQQFGMFVEMGDPQNLIGLLQRNRKQFYISSRTLLTSISIPYLFTLTSQ
jgi:hypothetical protein